MLSKSIPISCAKSVSVDSKNTDLCHLESVCHTADQLQIQWHSVASVCVWFVRVTPGKRMQNELLVAIFFTSM